MCELQGYSLLYFSLIVAAVQIIDVVAMYTTLNVCRCQHHKHVEHN